MNRGNACAARELFDEARHRGHKEAAVKLAIVCVEQGDMHAARAILVEKRGMGNADAEEYLNFLSSPGFADELSTRLLCVLVEVKPPGCRH
mmetsp:Transcript_102862/g.272243  ORF Transcript_102862/g.272243 Transcript_102862/m.272243 type:complete len:91 (+) Transcript_102862:1-273(+)